ncbi:unnamed protein product [Bursaphelenchus okinawaensis]|uniref:MADF domain-containing protein n=1 Tax=Bursaphelenchus okinawaensis TaxID=465554 RepID=A0A811LGM2_9BILA|nr:unnamed protein product [Bursaphelenchus okinawaensis]CAG9122034.1 unnamed protein product [Bursaphelenchus okinawaensis]
MVYRVRIPPAPITSCCLTPDQKDQLIRLVKDRPAIWDMNSQEYNNGNERRNAYAEVARIMSGGKYKYTSPEIQIEWKKLRDVFNRTLKKAIATNTDISWKYWKKMKFIAPPEQLEQLRGQQLCTATEDCEDIVQRLIDSSGINKEECIFENDEDGDDNKPVTSLEWISQTCDQVTNECTDNETPSPKESTSTKTEESEDVKVLEDTTEPSYEPVPKRRRFFQPASWLNHSPSVRLTNGPSVRLTNSPRTEDTFATFGAYVASQLRFISEKNKVNGVMLKREIMDLCVKYELDGL